MPAYKDTERQTPEQLAEFILKERVCKNCKWWDRVDELNIGECLTINYCHSYEDAVFKPQEDFGCNQWEAK